HIGNRRAGADLAHDLAHVEVLDRDLDAGLPGVVGRDVLQARIPDHGRGEDIYLCALRHGGRGQRGESRGEKKFAHDLLPYSEAGTVRFPISTLCASGPKKVSVAIRSAAQQATVTIATR